MGEDNHRVLILCDQANERSTYRRYLAESLDASFQIEEMNSSELEGETVPALADCVLIIQSPHGNERRLLHQLSYGQDNAPGLVFVSRSEPITTPSSELSPQIEYISADEVSPYRLVHAVQRSIERRDILRRIDDYAARLFDAQEILDQLWDDVVGPALILDLQGVVRRVNTPFLQLTQEAPDNFVGHDYTDFLPSMDEELFQERLSSILGEGSGIFWSGQFDADRQPQYPLRFSARVTGKKEPFSRLMVLVEPQMTEQPAPSVPASILMQRLEDLMQRYTPQMERRAIYELLINEAQESLEAQGVAVFSYNHDDQAILKEESHGSLPPWLMQNAKHSKDAYLFRNAIAERCLKVFTLTPAPEQSTSMLVTVPMIIQQRILGAICIAFETVRQLSSDERSFLMLLGSWAAQMIEHRRQHLHIQGDTFKASLTPDVIRSRSDILPVIAHELRTPLTVLMGYTQLLQRRLRAGSILEERNLRALHTILDRAQRVDATLETLVELARMDMGMFALQIKPVDVSALLRDVLLTQRRHTAHTLVFDGSEQAMVPGDEIRLRRVFSSVIHNAIVYSPDISVIRVIVESDHNGVRIVVIDEGEGIRTEQIGEIFTRFSNVRSEQTMGGMGVSLYMAKKIIDAHKGTITITSSPGSGSKVVIELPAM